MSVSLPHRAERPCHALTLPPSSTPEADGEGLEMIRSYRAHGGLVSCNEALELVRRHCDQPISRIARWIVAAEVVSFDWQSEMLLPLFQFDPSDMSLRPGVASVVSELAGVFDKLELAAWFTRANGWLAGATPLATITRDAPAVLEAARAERYIARS